MIRYLMIIISFTFIQLGCSGTGSISSLPGAGEDITATVSQEDALLIASNWLKAKDQSGRTNFSIREVRAAEFEQDGQKVTTSYLVIFEKGGFVLVSADLSLRPVLGYSMIGNPTVNLPADKGVNRFLTSINEQIGVALFSGQLKLPQQPAWQVLRSGSYAVSDAYQVVEPLITASWSQGHPYNLHTPTIDNIQTPVGCGAVALGQIMRYHAYPNHGKGTSAYQWNDQALKVDFLYSSYDWSLMTDKLTVEGVTEEQKDETARFLYEVGVSMRMDYRVGSSWAFTNRVVTAMKEYYRFDPALRNVYKNGYSEEDWNQLIQTELLEERPVFYRGAQENGSGGHFFVVDGQDSDGYFHVNWGWGGSSDGYFYLNNLTPTLHYGNSAILGAKPIEAAAGEACAGYAGTRCQAELACKNKINTIGICQPLDWCAADTAVADCIDAEPGTESGSWTCPSNACVWLPSGGAELFENEATISDGEWNHFGPFTVTAGGSLDAELTMTAGDADLYVRRDATPQEYSYDCRPYDGGTTTETCSFSGPGVFYVSINGYGYSTPYRLTVAYSSEGGEPIPDPVCGNAVAEGLEVCDASNLDCAELDPDFYAGTAVCNEHCDGLDTSACLTPICGNEIQEGDEFCEFGWGIECSDLSSKWRTGTAVCNLDCSNWDERDCREYICNDGQVEDGETCEIGDTIACNALNPGYASGTAVCATNCLSWVLDECVKEEFCGNAVTEGNEVCDENKQDCIDLDPDTWITGVAYCLMDCSGYDTAGCIAHPVCGNGEVEINEQCDQTDPLDCTELSSKFGSGLAYCTNCTGWNQDDCVLALVCGDGIVNNDEVCDGQIVPCTDLGPQYSGGEAKCFSTCDGWTTDYCEMAGPTQVTVNETGTVAKYGWMHYGPFDASSGEFKAIMTGDGDADIYVKMGSQPTSSSYDCRPYDGSTNETCTLSGPGQFYVSVNGYATSSNFALTITYWTGGSAPEPVVVTDSGSVQQSQWHFIGAFDTGDGEFKVVMTGDGDADLYVREDGKPDADNYVCRPYEYGSSESCTLQGPGNFFVSVYGYEPSNYNITITYLPAS